MEIIRQNIVGRLVAEDYRIAAVFQNYGIDFCINGDRSIEEVCLENNIDESLLIQEIDLRIAINDNQVLDYNRWPLDLLSEYIEIIHHKYVDNPIPIIKGYLKKIIAAHGKRHPELYDILDLFEETATELTLHMKREELMLFPQVRKMFINHKEGKESVARLFGSFKNPISTMMKDHTDEGARFKQIRTLSNDYEVPSDGCNSYKVTYKLLEEFEKDLHLHIHLENNILYPKAIDLENLKN